MLVASKRARIRVRVQDGFREAVATSARFAAVGASPRVRIVAPAAGTAVRAGAGLTLAGEAFDGAGGGLNGRALTWTTGRQLLGHGRLIVAAGLAPGRRRVILSARDRSGKTARATLVVRVTPARPLFTVLRAPARLSAKAKAVVLTVGPTYTSRLTVGQLHAGVGRTLKRVRVPVKPGRSLLQLQLTLGAGRLASRQMILIPRS